VGRTGQCAGRQHAARKAEYGPSVHVSHLGGIVDVGGENHRVTTELPERLGDPGRLRGGTGPDFQERERFLHQPSPRNRPAPHDSIPRPTMPMAPPASAPPGMIGGSAGSGERDAMTWEDTMPLSSEDVAEAGILGPCGLFDEAYPPAGDESTLGRFNRTRRRAGWDSKAHGGHRQPAVRHLLPCRRAGGRPPSEQRIELGAPRCSRCGRERRTAAAGRG